MIIFDNSRIDAAAIWNYSTTPTRVVKSSPNLAEIIFRPGLTKPITCFFDFPNRLPITANQNVQLSHQTGSWVVAQQIFDGFASNLV